MLFKNKIGVLLHITLQKLCYQFLSESYGSRALAIHRVYAHGYD